MRTRAPVLNRNSIAPLLFVLCGIIAGCEDSTVTPVKPAPLRIRASLIGLTVSSGTLSPAFDSMVQDYSLAVPFETDSLAVTPILPASADLSVTVNGATVRSGAASDPIALSSGGTDINLVVHSRSDSERVYTLHVLRAGRPSLPSLIEGSVNRRIYLNDRAAADSLPAALIRTGINFVMQPGKAYRLSVATENPRDSLDLFYYGGDRHGFFRTVTAVGDGSHQVFPLASDQDVPRFFTARLAASGSQRPPGGLGGIGGIGKVSLTSDSSLRADTLEARLLFIRKLNGLPDSLAKAEFAGRLFDALGGIFAPAGITFKGSFGIAEPDSQRMVFPFDRPLARLPGSRLPNRLHLYLVDSIIVGNPGSGLVGTLLGFAPREGVDPANDVESRVLLANPFGMGMTVSGLAITAAHEIGHLLGLRHTVSTRYDLNQDNDESNFEDGFADTKACVFDEALRKTGSGKSDKGNPEARFCLRTLAEPCRMTDCDLKNLMFPVDCGIPGQSQLSSEQADFLKRNLATFRR